MDTAGERPDGRDTAGRFAPGNAEGKRRGIKSQIRKSLGDAADLNNGELVRSALRLYFAMVRELPSDGAAVRALCAASARHGTLAGHFANLSAAAGLGSDDGLRYAEASRSHDLASQRLSVSAFDRSIREAKARPPADPHRALEAAFGTSAVLPPMPITPEGDDA